jgi:hypothetical protein
VRIAQFEQRLLSVSRRAARVCILCIVCIVCIEAADHIRSTPGQIKCSGEAVIAGQKGWGAWGSNPEPTD